MTETMFAFWSPGPGEMLIIGAVIVLLFGATRLPQLAKALGQSKRAFKEGLDEADKDEEKEAKQK